jgi:hypothetical protein
VHVRVFLALLEYSVTFKRAALCLVEAVRSRRASCWTFVHLFCCLTLDSGIAHSERVQ